MEKLRLAVAWLLGIFMIGIGTTHFTDPAPFVAIVPAVLPAKLALVYISGAAEIAGGLGLLWARTRRAAALGLIALYVAVFPANVNMALHHLPLGGREVPPALLWARLPFQLVFIGLAYFLTRRRV